MRTLRIGNGFDVHAFGPGEYITLGGIQIKHSAGLVAHSDGDVLIHALCDALLGALALGDIGLHFPDNSADYKGIDSKILLLRTCELIRSKGYSIGNVDCTVCAQAPKLRDHIDTMRECLSGVMDIPVEDLSVKATTTERLGFVGREEGISVYSTVLLFAD